MEGRHLIDYRNVTVNQQEFCILDGIDFHLDAGEFVYLIGKVGSGKTSLLKAFLGLAPLAAGEIRVGEYMLSEHTCGAIRKQVLYLPQDLALPYTMVDEAVTHVLRVGGLRYDRSLKALLYANMKKR